MLKGGRAQRRRGLFPSLRRENPQRGCNGIAFEGEGRLRQGCKFLVRGLCGRQAEMDSLMSTRAGPLTPPGPVAVRTMSRSPSSMFVATRARIPLKEYSDCQQPFSGPVVSAWMQTLPPAVMWPVCVCVGGGSSGKKHGAATVSLCFVSTGSTCEMRERKKTRRRERGGWKRKGKRGEGKRRRGRGG